ELETVEQKKLLATRVEELIINGGNSLSTSAVDEQVEQLAQHYFTEIKSRKRYDVKQGNEDWETVKMSSLKNKDAREIGAEWLCKQAFDQLGIYSFLQQAGWKEDKIALATTHIISRAVYPSSELKSVSFIKENSAISEITGIDKDKLTKDLLYGISHKLYKIKTPLEQYLSKRTNDLFDLEDKIILYDLTNTYFEGRKTGSKIAKFGRSKEKRNDARIVVLAVVINREGFLKYSNIFEGNMADCKTLGSVIDTMSNQTSWSHRKPIVVIDAGIATDGNIAMLKNKGYDYMCVSRSSLKEYNADTTALHVEIKDKKNQLIELLKVKTCGDNDQYLWVRSQAKALKEKSMNGLLSQRFEEGIQNIQEGITKKGGTKKLNKVYERIGRLKQKYPSVHNYYDINIRDDGNGTATNISCRHKTGEDPDKQAGIYFLRTSLKRSDEKTLWSIYNIIREIEYTFRVLKSDLDLRPIYHKTDSAAMAHLHLGMLAYWLVATIRYQLKQQGINSDWREIVRTMNTQKCVTTSLVNIKNETISIRQCTEPTKEVKKIYDLLKYKYAPFVRKKSVVPPAEIFKNDSP
ncbi:MAG TPA: IS1634 family transposase, partial [Syntrophorhabdaceae bacterium]|nr:IS1634 family transposase [Syntrophorhabdaceae bacterium]